MIKNIKQNKNYLYYIWSFRKIHNKNKTEIKNIKVPLLGIHNVRNSVAAAAVSLTVGISIPDIKKGLINFKGVKEDLIKYLHLMI